MLMMRERPCSTIALLLPAPLPSLSDALARRASAFGPFDGDDMPLAPARLSRRSGLFAVACAMVAAVLPAASLDRALTLAEAEIRAADAALSAIYAIDPEGTSAEAEADRLSDRWCAALRRMADTPARGPDGLAAKARVVGLLSAQNDVEMVAVLAPSLAADALRLRRLA